MLEYVNKNCTAMTCALVNFSPWLSICSWLELRGKIADIKEYWLLVFLTT